MPGTYNITNNNLKFISMERFLLIMREDLKKIGQYTDDERFSNIPEMEKWIETIAESGNYVEGIHSR
jgi:hypothetical protein